MSTTQHTSTAKSGYAICTVGRSGSTWFGALLQATDVLGRPREFFNTPSQRERIKGYPSDRNEQVRLVLTEGTTPNGVYGVKVFPGHMGRALHHIRWSEVLPDLHFIHWMRRDVLGQALSRQRASHTMQWRSSDDSGRPPPPFDGESILNAMRWAVVQNARWELFFARNGISPLRFVYEDVMADPQAAVEAVGALFGLKVPPVDLSKTGLNIQRDETTEVWRTRFQDEYRDIDVVDLLDVEQVTSPELVTFASRRARGEPARRPIPVDRKD